MRDYDPTTGRYIQADPLGLVPGPGVYDYAYQNPMYWTDPTGECPWCAAAAVAVAGVALGYALDWLAGYLESMVDENGCNICEPLFGSSVLSAAAGASAADGSFMMGPKPFTTPESSPGSSIQSSVSRKVIPYRFPNRPGTNRPYRVYTPNPRRWPWPTTTSVGGAVGRWLPVVGYAYSGYNVFRIVRCLTR